MLQFANPQHLYLLLAVPALLLLYLWSGRRKRAAGRRLGDRELLRRLTPGHSPWRGPVKFALMLVAVALCAVLLARPQRGLKSQTDTLNGIEAVVMVDVSNSMLSPDVRPSRLDRAKLLVSNLVDRMRNDKIALGVFAGEAYPQLPITSDYASAKVFLDALSPEMVTLQGTNLAAAINLGRKSFTESKGVGKALILITDGEDHEPGAEEAAAAAATEGVNVYVLGVGTTAGGSIPVAGGRFLQDANGQTVRTALNEEMCRGVAKAGKGLYLHLDQTNTAQEALQAQLSRLKQGSVTTSYTVKDEQFQAIALLLLVVLVAEVCLRENRNTFFNRFKLFKQ